MSNKTFFDWDEKTGISVCSIRDGNKLFQGFAYCREEDEDMKNKYTGQTIAEMRALIQQAKDIRDNELKPGLTALNRLKYSMNQSKYFNPDSYEYRMIERQIQHYEEDLIIIKDTINKQKQWLNNYMQEKAEFYEKVRNNRQKAKNQ